MAHVYWTSRDLDSFFLGNHQFILVELTGSETLSRTTAEEERGTRFVTLGGHQPYGDLVFIPNQVSDVESVKETILSGNNRTSFFSSDYDMEKHLIRSPTGGTGIDFATNIERLAYNYRANTASTPLEYGLLNYNCATWVNTLLKIAGVSRAIRLRAGEFSGIDWGEEDLLDEALFR